MPELTKRETETLTLLANGCANATIAERLRISLPTVAMHLQSARRRLQARSREQAVAIAVARGLIKLIEMEDTKRSGSA